ncbi:hypothetical protein AVEN_75810-1 [Araneus ventricosus]|uniref:Uncharacterized protein n=1 Tax=Araneus ventricosus TaxID=182803 RepID=A0A4Y2RFG5_ARAVE|nr:hypothetical protein AVEN_21284-1 [Araneus ventricosus]GBN74484.1 hypothetical protein AVEN_75810-1 [Araneus ventricosus]
MTRTTHELAPPLRTSETTPVEDIRTLSMIKRGTGPIHEGSSVQSCFGPEAETLQLGHHSLLSIVSKEIHITPKNLTSPKKNKLNLAFFFKCCGTKKINNIKLYRKS